MSDKILIIGLGSIGQRHARNALALGCEVIGYDMRPITLELRAASAVTFVDSLKVGLDCKPLGVIIATPPETHYRLAMNFPHTPMLIEKPVTASAVDAEYLCNFLEGFDMPLAVGYQFRHTTTLRRLKAQVDAGEFGTIYAAHAEFASQKWCSHTYPADLLLECSHELDLLRWLLGDPREARGHKTHAGWQLSFKTYEWSGTMSLDGIAPGYRRRFTIYGTKDIGEWALNQAENDQAYVDELAEFLRLCRGEQAEPSCTGRDGWWAVRMVEAIRQSGGSGKWEAV